MKHPPSGGYAAMPLVTDVTLLAQNFPILNVLNRLAARGAAVQRDRFAPQGAELPQQLPQRGAHVHRLAAHAGAGRRALDGAVMRKSLGGGLIWPSSMGFVHVTEAQRDTAPDGTQRFVISPALTNVFLPRRKAVLEAFLNGV
jgi:hypothetical protein